MADSLPPIRSVPLQRQPAARPADPAARAAAQQAFFAAALGRAQPAAPAAAPARVVATAPAAPIVQEKAASATEAPQRYMRPGSLLDIKV